MSIFEGNNLKTFDCDPFLNILKYMGTHKHYELQLLYYKNLDMVKQTLSIERKLPDIKEIELFFKEMFLSRF